MTTNTCPFCGVLTDLPHETQEACISALHAEIARVRAVVDRVRHRSPDADESDPRDDPPAEIK
jgi:hypothetical protein